MPRVTEKTSIFELYGKTTAKFRRSSGLYVDGDMVYITQLVNQFKGIKVEKSVAIPLTDKKLSDLLMEHFPDARPLEEEAGEYSRKRRQRLTMGQRITKMLENIPEMVSIGIKDAAVFYYAFASSAKHTKTLDIDAIVSENPKAEFLNSPTLISDWMTMEVEGQNYVLICAAKKSLVQDTWQQFDSMSLKPLRTEAGTWAALRAAWHAVPPSPKGAEIRVLLGSKMTLAALSLGNMPLSWQLAHTDSANLAQSLFPNLQSLLIYGQRQLNLKSVSTIIVQGENIPAGLQLKLTEQMGGIPVKVIPGKPYDGNLIAYGLALGAQDMEAKTMNLSKGLQKPISLLATFPYLESVITLATVFLTILFLYSKAQSLESQVRIRQVLNEQTVWAQGQNNDEIEITNNKIKSDIAPIQDFYSKRIPWVPVMEALAETLPDEAFLTYVSGSDPIWIKGKSGAGLEMRVTIKPFDAKTKPETVLENYLETLKENAVIVAHFPKISLAMVTIAKAGDQIDANIIFSK